VEAFSDAVFAVIITNMALELRAPAGTRLPTCGTSRSPSIAAIHSPLSLHHRQQPAGCIDKAREEESADIWGTIRV
jgi:Endosomal/lysosomal potassium channel TMEM175